MIITWLLATLLSAMAKFHANARNNVGQQGATLLSPTCCVLLQLVGSCWMKFETGQTSAPTRANISIVSRSSKRGPTMLSSFAWHIQQSCTDARALHTTYIYKYMQTRNQHDVGDGKRERGINRGTATKGRKKAAVITEVLNFPSSEFPTEMIQ